ncbi:sensor histidine kinase [Streptomyces sp. enrichment culture]|uniref:sensor histidine kinase n=1 Tax=Streptomyces sp. enrichment culture TaxID=1795815 RepID=UPI003F573997
MRAQRDHPQLDGFDTGILASLANQAAPALASLRLQEELRSSREQIVTAREEERRHLRRDIHDGLGPTLAGLRLRVENATLSLPADDPVREALRGVSDGLGTAVTEVRRITEHLGPAPLVELGLTGALRQLVCAFDGARTRIDADLSPSFLPSLSAAVEVAAHRIAAEALTNVVRHARAAHARLRVRVDADRLTLTVLDDGIGIDPEPRHRGVGLRSMAERAAEIGGHCSIDRLSPGTRVCAVLPRSRSCTRRVRRRRRVPHRTDSGAVPVGTARMARSGDRRLSRTLSVMPAVPTHRVAVAPDTEPETPPRSPPSGAASGPAAGARGACGLARQLVVLPRDVGKLLHQVEAAGAAIRGAAE